MSALAKNDLEICCSCWNTLTAEVTTSQLATTHMNLHRSDRGVLPLSFLRVHLCCQIVMLLMPCALIHIMCFLIIYPFRAFVANVAKTQTVPELTAHWFPCALSPHRHFQHALGAS